MASNNPSDNLQIINNNKNSSGPLSPDSQNDGSKHSRKNIPPKIPTHNRSVSHSSHSRRQVDIDGRSTTNSVPSVISARGLVNDPPRANILISQLENTVSSFETQAERAIIEALEKRERKLSSDYDDTTKKNVGFANDVVQQITSLSDAESDRRLAAQAEYKNVTFDKSFRADFKDITKSYRNLTVAAEEHYEQGDVESLLGEKIELEPSTPNTDLRKRMSTLNLVVEQGDEQANENKNMNASRRKNNFQSTILSSFEVVEGGGKYVYTGIKSLFQRFFDYIQDNSKYIHRHLWVSIMYIMVPALILSTILFYGAGNPRWNNKKNTASFSWILIFIFVRQTITYSLAKMTVSFLIDFLALKTLLFVKIFGPVITLMIVQSKGWPMVFIFWAIWDFGLLYGSSPFSANWLYWQEPIRMFNNENPNGGVPGDKFYQNVIICVLVAGIIITAERIWVAFYLGRKRYATYHKQLEKILRKMLIVTEVARLSFFNDEAVKPEESLRKSKLSCSMIEETGFNLIFNSVTNARSLEIQENDDIDDDEIVEREDEDGENASTRCSDRDAVRDPTFSGNEDLFSHPSGNGSRHQRNRSNEIHENRWVEYKGLIAEKNEVKKMQMNAQAEKNRRFNLLGAWEEPKRHSIAKDKKGSIKDVLHYRESLSYMDSKYPFTLAFGLADTRIHCMESADIVFDRFVSKSTSDVLYFDTIANVVSMDPDGQVDAKKMKYLMKVFTPNRKGYLTRVDFLRCCDGVYKEIRLFRAATSNAAQIDSSVEVIFNVLLGFVLFILLLLILGYNPLTLFVSLTSFLFTFTFMFGNASSKFFEGILLVLVRQPYDIGDRIAVSDAATDTNSNGSTTWFVEGITLFMTTVRNAATNEVATYSNASLANLRIINAARSPKACVYVYMQFGIEVPYEKIKLFHSIIESFVKERPSEWVGLLGFRACNIEVNQGFINYVLVLQHMNAWQDIGPILKSKADVASYCLEVSKQMGMRFVAPPMPVNLTLDQKSFYPFETTGGVKESKIKEEDLSEQKQESVFEYDLTNVTSLFKKK